MRTHTSQFKDEIKQYGRQFTDTIYYNNTTYTGEHINSVNYSVDTSLCKSVMQTLIIDTDISMNVGDTLDYGISIDGVTGSEIRFNNFIVNKIEDQKDKKSNLVTCYDNMIKTMQDYESFYDYTTDTTFSTNKNYYELDNGKYKRYTGARTGNPQSLGLYQSMFPTTIKNYIYMICYRLGITFKNLNGSFTNYSKTVKEEHYVDVDGNSLGYTYRDVLDDIAEATGSFICIDNSGKLEVRGLTNTNDTINEEYFNDKNVNIGKKIGPYNVVVLSREDVDNIYYPATLPSNPIEFKISDNAILDQDNREDFIQGIYNKINGLEFYLNDFATNGILYYEIGDKYNVSIDNTTYPCLMLSDNIKRTTGLKENIITKEPKQSVTEFKYASATDKLEKQSRNAYIIANKAEGTASMIVEGIGSGGVVTGASVIASINNDSSQVNINADKININGVVSANNSFTIDTNGNMTCNNANITGGYLELTDDPDVYDDRLSIQKKNSTEVTTATSEYIIIKKAINDDYNYAQMSLDGGLNHIYGDSTEFHFGDITGDQLTLNTFENGSAHRLYLTPYDSRFYGDVSIGGDLTASVFKSYGPGMVNSQTLEQGLQIKEASSNEAPNNGIVLEYSKYSGWGGQLYIGDNADTGLYYNGWSNGNRGSWKKLAFEEDSGWQDLTLQNGVTARSQDAAYKPQYRKIGNIVYLKGQITIPSHSGDLQMAVLPSGYRPSYEAKMPSLGVGAWIDTGGGIILQASGNLQYQSINTTWVVD